MAPLLASRDETEFGTHAREPIAGVIMSVILSLTSVTVLSSFLSTSLEQTLGDYSQAYNVGF